jgi:hypothetical protein
MKAFDNVLMMFGQRAPSLPPIDVVNQDPNFLIALALCEVADAIRGIQEILTTMLTPECQPLECQPLAPDPDRCKILCQTQSENCNALCQSQCERSCQASCKVPEEHS